MGFDGLGGLLALLGLGLGLGEFGVGGGELLVEVGDLGLGSGDGLACFFDGLGVGGGLDEGEFGELPIAPPCLCDLTFHQLFGLAGSGERCASSAMGRAQAPQEGTDCTAPPNPRLIPARPEYKIQGGRLRPQAPGGRSR